MWYVGTSGWQYDSWKGVFYPRGLPQARWLEHYVTRFPTVEVNNTFYRLPERTVFAGWADRTPSGFVVTCKLSRFLSHIRRLRDPEDAVRRFLERAAPLRQAGKLGPLLLQLPPNLSVDAGRLAATLDAVPDDLRVVVEFRHDSWFTRRVADLLADHDAAVCLVDRRSRRATPLWRTAPWGYLRLHEGTATPRPCYGDHALRTWIDRLLDLWDADRDVFVYFNNDPRACAPKNAERFIELADRAGAKLARSA
ncbi:MAG: DUF72 domain-containing protein [Acidimicrobiales bacterium]